MTQEFKDQWLEALRSGKYEQGKGALRTVHNHSKDGFCCLGVLCDLIPDGTWDDQGIFNHYKSFSTSSMLPNNIPAIRVSSADQSTLIEMNDGKNHSFTQIANWIEINIIGD